MDFKPVAKNDIMPAKAVAQRLVTQSMYAKEVFKPLFSCSFSVQSFGQSEPCVSTKPYGIVGNEAQVTK